MWSRVQTLLQKVRRGDLALSVLVPEASITRACEEADYRSRAWKYTPVKTVLTFLAQVLLGDGSCQQAVNGLIAHQAAEGRRRRCSADTGGYCKSRSRIPEGVLWNLARQAGRSADCLAAEGWRWLGHVVRVVDGSTLQIADTAANRAEYPLQKNLAPGLHYPVVRILVVFSLAVGTVLEGAMSPYQGKGTGETGMLRDLADKFAPGQILLADRYYAGYWDVAFWLARGVHLVSVNSKSRKTDYRIGRRLGTRDHLVEWTRTDRPDWAEDETARLTPRRLLMRELRISIDNPGFRTRKIDVITTLTDPQAYPKEQIEQLYRLRWQAELQLRSLKTHMGMGRLRCKTPEMVRKEFAMYLLAYNCVRRVGLEAALVSGRMPREISFKNTMQAAAEFLPRLHQAPDLDLWLTSLLETVAQVIVANRPNRTEPYQTKTRPKDWPKLSTPRQKIRGKS